jgi:hypothetical protein
MAKGGKSIGSNKGVKLTHNRSGTKKRTSIGKSSLSKPNNKHKIKNHKVYRGQGK